MPRCRCALHGLQRLPWNSWNPGWHGEVRPRWHQIEREPVRSACEVHFNDDPPTRPLWDQQLVGEDVAT